MHATVDRVVRAADVDVADAGRLSTAIDQVYDDQLDVIVVRRALDPARLAAVGDAFDRDDASVAWARPNAKIPIEDIHVLGADIPATPTYAAPTGASLECSRASSRWQTRISSAMRRAWASI